jgi:hypothetical protein
MERSSCGMSTPLSLPSSSPQSLWSHMRTPSCLSIGSTIHQPRDMWSPAWELMARLPTHPSSRSSSTSPLSLPSLGRQLLLWNLDQSFQKPSRGALLSKNKVSKKSTPPSSLLLSHPPASPPPSPQTNLPAGSWRHLLLLLLRTQYSPSSMAHRRSGGRCHCSNPSF